MERIILLQAVGPRLNFCHLTGENSRLDQGKPVCALDLPGVNSKIASHPFVEEIS